ncbi:Potassium channel, partial [Spiromyces aspiralis]
MLPHQQSYYRTLTSDPLERLKLIDLIESPAPDRHPRFKHWIRSRHNYRLLVTCAGYMMPVNVLLNVISVGNGWLVYNNPDADHRKFEYIGKGAGYTACAVISLILICISAISFILRCLEFNVRHTTIVSVLANLSNSIIGLVSAVMFVLREAPKYRGVAHLSGEYYSTYAGCAVSIFDATLLIIDALITPGFHFRGSGMSPNQRTLQLIIILIIVWTGIGGYIYACLEPWDIVEAMFFCVVTYGTIGFGNDTPSSVRSRVFTLFYGSLGILFFGLLLLNTRNVVIQV